MSIRWILDGEDAEFGATVLIPTPWYTARMCHGRLMIGYGWAGILDECVASSDAVILHVPLNSESLPHV